MPFGGPTTSLSQIANLLFVRSRYHDYQEAGIKIQGWPGPKLELYMELLLKWIYTSLSLYIYIYILIFGNLGTNVANGSIRILTFGYQCCKWIDPNIDI